VSGAAFQLAQKSVAEIEDPVGDFALIEDVRHENEKRRRQHRIVRKHIAGNDRENLSHLRGRSHDEINDGRRQHGKRNRHADDEADCQCNE